jgi:VIT1/CCC1 family predicted Fe2+/Mn2+ transporter
MSMAAGEYVSVHSQSDTEKADLDRERNELATQDEAERAELAHIYVERGLDENLAKQVAEQLMAKDALGAHARDELGITETQTARPLQAAAASAASFAVGAAIPLVVTALTPIRLAMYTVGAASLVLLGALGALGANAGGAPMGRAAIRVTFWGALAMAITSAVGAIFGVVG